MLMKNHERTVVVLGASDSLERYSNRAIRLLKSEGYRTIPVHPSLKDIEGLTVIHGLPEIREKVDTLTVYLGPDKCVHLVDDIIAMKPGRVILNPGTESETIEDRLLDAEIPIIHACTLVMLGTGRF